MADFSVLIVDDDLLICDCIEKVFEMVFKCEIIAVAESGETALEELKKKRFDLLFTDRTMPPGMNGEELIRQAKLLWSDIRTIMMTGDEDLFDFNPVLNVHTPKDIKKIGADAILKKPAPMPEIISAVECLFPPK